MDFEVDDLSINSTEALTNSSLLPNNLSLSSINSSLSPNNSSQALINLSLSSINSSHALTNLSLSPNNSSQVPTNSSKLSRSLLAECGDVKEIDLLCDDFTCYMIPLTDEIIIRVKASIMNKKRIRLQDDYFDKTHLCLLCFNENVVLSDCCFKIGKSSSGNAYKHLKNMHDLTLEDLKTNKEFDDYNEYKKKKIKLNNIIDLDLVLKGRNIKINSTMDSTSFAKLCTQLEIILGLSYGALKCKSFFDVLIAFKYGNFNYKNIPNRNKSKKIMHMIYNDEMKDVQEELRNTQQAIGRGDKSKFICAMHDKVSLFGTTYSAGMLSFITTKWEKLTIPIPMKLHVKEVDCVSELESSFKSLWKLENIIHMVGDNEPASLKTSKVIMNNIAEEDNELLSVNDMFVKQIGSGCVTHIINLIVSYCFGLKKSTKKKQKNSYNQIPDIDSYTCSIVDMIIAVHELTNKYEISAEIRKEAELQKKKIYKCTIPNATRWNSLYFTIKTYLLMRDVWRNVESLRYHIDKIDVNHVHIMYAFLDIFHKITIITEYKKVPIGAWFGPLIASIITKYGVDISLLGLNTPFCEIFNIEKQQIINEYLLDFSSVSFNINGMTLSINELPESGKELVKCIQSHLAFRFLPRDDNKKMPNIYIWTCLSHPFAKRYIRGFLGKQFGDDEQEKYLRMAIDTLLPESATHGTSSFPSFSSSSNNQLSYFKRNFKDQSIVSYLNYDATETMVNKNPHGDMLDEILQAIPRENALIFWKDNDLFPKIKLLNMQLLAVDISSSTIESYFSQLKDTITAKRMCMHPDLLSKSVATRYLLHRKNDNVKMKNNQNEEEESEAEMNDTDMESQG